MHIFEEEKDSLIIFLNGDLFETDKNIFLRDNNIDVLLLKEQIINILNNESNYSRTLRLILTALFTVSVLQE